MQNHLQTKWTNIREPKVYVYMRNDYIIDEELRERLLYLQMIDVSVSDKRWRIVVISRWNITMSIDKPWINYTEKELHKELNEEWEFFHSGSFSIWESSSI